MKWDAAYVASLPDSSFAYVEPEKKDADGNTLKGARHLPYKDKDGKVDLPHLRNALARIGETDIPAEAKAAALKKLQAAAKGAKVGKYAEALSLEQLRDAVYAALRAKLGHSYASDGSSWCIVATFQDAAIVQTAPGKLFRYPLTVESDGDVEIGEPEAVEIAYQALAEARVGVLGPLPLAEGKDGKDWACLVIEEGLSQNKRMYTAKALRASARLFEGAQCYFTHAASMKAEPDPRDLAGFLRNPRVGLIEASSKTAIFATFRSTSSRATELLQEAFEADHPGLFGLSINAQGTGQLVKLSEGVVYRVDSIDSVDSVDIVAKPAAGGRFLRLVAGVTSPVPVSEEDILMLETLIATLRESRPDLAARLSATPTEAEVRALLKEAITQPAPAAPPAQPAAPAAPATPAPVTFTEAQAQRLLRLEHELMVDRAMAGRTMHEKLKAKLSESLRARIGMSEAEIKAEVDRFVELSAEITQPATAGTGLGQPAGSGVEITGDAADKFAEGLEGMLFADARPEVRAEYKRRFGKEPARGGYTSLKGCYIEATGDARVAGVVESKSRARYTAFMEAARNRSAQLLEASGLQLTEAIGTGTFSSAFASTLNRRLLSEYGSTDLANRWRQVVSTVKPLPDFRNQERIRVGHLGDLSTVLENGTYQEFANPTDEKVSYAATKRGNILSISREAIKNDDIGLVRLMPMRIALAAARTLHKFVFNLIVGNPTLDDSVALFAASTSRGFSSAGNLQTSALSKTTVNVARQRLLRVTDRDAQTQLALSPKILIVPPELEETAIQLTTNPVITTSGQNATEPNYVAQKYGLNQYIVLETMSDTNDWFILADPRLVDTIEMGFVDGQEEPLILIQDNDTVGNVFTADKWTWKVRHEWGGDVVEWRGMQGGIVP